MKTEFYHMNNVKHIFHKSKYGFNIQQGQSVMIKTLWYGVFRVMHDIDNNIQMVFIENVK